MSLIITPSGYLLADGSIPLTANWNMGAFSATANGVIIGSAANTISLNSASGGNGTLSSTTNATKGKIFWGTLSVYDEVNDRLGLGITSPTEKLHLVGGTLVDGRNAFKMTATLPTTMTGSNFGADIQVTSAGSSAQLPSALRVSLLAGWTGAASSFAMYAQNQVAGTATNEFSFAQAANYGEYIATTTGTIIGQAGYASGGNRSYGGLFRSIVNKNSATNIGVAGYGLNGGTTPIQIGGYFALINSAPTFLSAALIANNGSQTSPIFLGQDNGSTVFTIADGGDVTALANIKLGTAGNGFYVKEGSNATMGASTLVAGTVTVSTTKVTASSRIFLTVQSLGTVAVATPIAVTARSAGTSFTITSSGITDTSVVGWIIMEPA